MNITRRQFLGMCVAGCALSAAPVHLFSAPEHPFITRLKQGPVIGENWVIDGVVIKPDFKFHVDSCHFTLLNGASFDFTDPAIDCGSWFCNNYITGIAV